MYSPKQIWRGLKQPRLIYKEFYDSLIEKQLQRLINKKISINQDNKNTEYGLIINWGYHSRGKWPTAEYPFLVEQLIEEFDPVIIPTQNSYQKYKDKVDFIISFEPKSPKTANIIPDSRAEHTIGVFVGHTHDKKNWFDTYVYENNIDFVFSRYYHPFLEHFPDFDTSRLVHIPWAMPERHINESDNIEFHGQDDIQIFGARGEEMYKVREKCCEYPFVNYHDNSGVNKKLTNKEYYRWCREFDAMIAAGSFAPQYKYVFAKYFEIAAAGCLLIAQYCDDLDKLGFDNTNCIIFNEGEFERKATEYLSNPEDYLSVRKSGIELIKDDHKISDRVKKIKTCLS